MATNDVNLQVINSMTQEQMQSLKDSSGKIPSLANQLIITDEEDVNLSQLRTKVLWTNSNPSSSFASQTITLSSNGYDYLVLFYKTSYDSNAVISKIFPKGYGTEIDISEVFNGDYVSVNRCRVVTRNSDISLTIGNCQTGVLRNGGGTERYLTDNAMLVPIQIIGLYKSPSMIYTGAELHDGNGISIKDGVISGNYCKLLWSNDNIGINSGILGQTISLDLTEFDLFLICYYTRPYSDRGTYSSIMVPKNKTFTALDFDLDGNRKYRNFTITDTGITFDNGTPTDSCAPYKIYGFKIGV